MSRPPEKPWSEDEKYALLTEVLKQSGIPSIYLVNIINSFQVKPVWEHIPLPPGRTLNSCQRAFDGMCQQPMQQPTQQPMQPLTGPISLSAPRHESSVPPRVRPEMGPSRKRPLLPSSRPSYTPRAIQPRPPPPTSPPPSASATSYSSGSGASTLSPGLEVAAAEQPRKRGRPSKAESEQRKAAAQAQGRLYHSPRRLESRRREISTPPTTSSAAVGPTGSSYESLATTTSTVPRETPTSTLMRFQVADHQRELAHVGPRRGSGRGSDSRQMQLPRPPELEQMLPSLDALHFGRRQRELAPRTTTTTTTTTTARVGEGGVSSNETAASGRIPLLADGRRAMIHPINESPDRPPSIFYPEAPPSTRPAER